MDFSFNENHLFAQFEADDQIRSAVVKVIKESRWSKKPIRFEKWKAIFDSAEYLKNVELKLVILVYLLLAY